MRKSNSRGFKAPRRINEVDETGKEPPQTKTQPPQTDKKPSVIQFGHHGNVYRFPTTEFTGLSNPSNICFLNSAVQCLLNTDVLTSFFNNRALLHGFKLRDVDSYDLLEAYQLKVLELKSSIPVPFSSNLYDLFRIIYKIDENFGSGEDQDADEVLSLILNNLSAGLTLCGLENIIEDTFQSEMKTEITCLNCKDVSSQVKENFFILHLPVTHYVNRLNYVFESGKKLTQTEAMLKKGCTVRNLAMICEVKYKWSREKTIYCAMSQSLEYIERVLNGDENVDGIQNVWAFNCEYHVESNKLVCIRTKFRYPILLSLEAEISSTELLEKIKRLYNLTTDFDLYWMNPNMQKCALCFSEDDCTGCAIKPGIVLKLSGLDTFDVITNEHQQTGLVQFPVCETNSKILTIQNLIQMIKQIEVVDRTCEKCQFKVGSIRKMISELNSVLIIGLERFDNYGTFLQTPIQVQREISFKGNNGKVIYELYAALLYILSGTRGHYISYCKSASGKWFQLNDNLVELIEFQGKTINKHAYLLFYKLKI